jgi:hypothetical protein
VPLYLHTDRRQSLVGLPRILLYCSREATVAYLYCGIAHKAAVSRGPTYARCSIIGWTLMKIRSGVARTEGIQPMSAPFDVLVPGMKVVDAADDSAFVHHTRRKASFPVIASKAAELPVKIFPFFSTAPQDTRLWSFS